MIFEYREVNKLKKKLKGNVVFTSGCFDLIHKGHIQMLKDSKKLGDLLVVGIFPDSYAEKHKGKGRPIHKQRDRAIIINALGVVDHVLLLTPNLIEGKLPVGAVRELKPTTYATRSAQWGKYSQELKKEGITVTTLKRKKVNSTTRIIDRVKKR